MMAQEDSEQGDSWHSGTRCFVVTLHQYSPSDPLNNFVQVLDAVMQCSPYKIKKSTKAQVSPQRIFY
jgi:hypothetical protein